jgi:copper chaperone CopZ
MTHKYNVAGITCTSCQAKVQVALSQVEGVKNVQVAFPGGLTTIEMDKHISTAVFENALKPYPKYQITEEAPKPVIPIVLEEEKRTWLQTYKPLLLVFGYILLVSLIAAWQHNTFHWMKAMNVFMAAFFLVFSFFKMLDLNGFADTYSMYDIIAKKFRSWAFVYAFIELFLGIAYATNFYPVITNMATILVMGVSIIGVLQSVLHKRKIKCACLGAVFNLPMSTVTIIEDLLMIGMAIASLFIIQTV